MACAHAAAPFWWSMASGLVFRIYEQFLTQRTNLEMLIYEVRCRDRRRLRPRLAAAAAVGLWWTMYHSMG